MSKMVIDIPYYSDNSRISNSNLGFYLKGGPKYLKDMMDGKQEGMSASFLEKGTMIHEYILQPEEFWKDYVVLDFDTPKIKQQKDFCDSYVKESQLDPLSDENTIILKSYNNAYSNSKPYVKKLEEGKFILATYSKYIEYLKVPSDKKIISFNDVNTLKKIKDNLQKHKKANELLFALPDTYESFNEFHINWEVDKENCKVKCKSLLDRVCFDHVNKKIILIDLKTTVNVYDFKHSVEEYDYFRQIAYYGLAIQWYMANVLNLNTEDYDFEAYIIAIGKDVNNEIRVFDMKVENVINEKLQLINNVLQKISYHISTDNWEHSPEYYEGNGVEELKCVNI